MHFDAGVAYKISSCSDHGSSHQMRGDCKRMTWDKTLKSASSWGEFVDGLCTKTGRMDVPIRPSGGMLCLVKYIGRKARFDIKVLLVLLSFIVFDLHLDGHKRLRLVRDRSRT